MQDLSREAILRMIGLHDAAYLSRQLNAIQFSLEEESGKMVTYWTEIRKTEKEVTLIAGRMDDAETDIAQLQVTAGQISASVSSLQTTVNGHTTSIGQLTITTNSISQDVSNISDEVDAVSGTVTTHTSQISTLRTDLNGISATVTADHTTLTTHTSQISTLRTDLNGISATVTADHTTLGTHTTQIGSLQVTANSISNRVTVIEGDYVKEAEISLMVKKDGSGYISNASIKADNILFTFTDIASFVAKQGSTQKEVMNINPNGDLWILGNLKGGNIQGNYNIGTTGNKMEIYVDEVRQGYITTSGLRGYDSNGNVLLDLRVLGTSVSDNSGYLYLYSSDGKYSILDTRSISFIPSNGGGALTFGYNGDGKVYIYAPISYWPSLSGSTLVGQVYVDNGYLRIRTS